MTVINHRLTKIGDASPPDNIIENGNRALVTIPTATIPIATVILEMVEYKMKNNNAIRPWKRRMGNYD